MFRLCKLLTTYIFLHAATIGFSQNDSIGRRIKGFQAEISSAPWVMPFNPSQQELQAIAPPGIFLDRDLTGYTKQNLAWITNESFRGMAGIKLFITETNRAETFVGVRYGQALIVGTSYRRSTTDTASVSLDTLSGRVMMVLNESEDLFNYSILADRLYFPMGFNFFTSQKKMFWASVGLEVCPFINFSYLFQSGISYYRSVHFVESGEQQRGFSGFTESGNYYQFQKVKGMSVGGYVGIPLAVHFHPLNKQNSKSANFHVFATLLPVFSFNSSEFGKPVTAGSVVVNAGIRYNLR